MIAFKQVKVGPCRQWLAQAGGDECPGGVLVVEDRGERAVGRDGCDAAGCERLVREVSLVAGDDRVGVAGDGVGQDVSMGGIGQVEAAYVTGGR